MVIDLVMIQSNRKPASASASSVLVPVARALRALPLSLTRLMPTWVQLKPNIEKATPAVWAPLTRPTTRSVLLQLKAKSPAPSSAAPSSPSPTSVETQLAKEEEKVGRKERRAKEQKAIEERKAREEAEKLEKFHQEHDRMAAIAAGHVVHVVSLEDGSTVPPQSQSHPSYECLLIACE